jgi:hypothetical protein
LTISPDCEKVPGVHLKFGVVGMLAVFWSGCTFVSTGARSAVVVLVRSEVTSAGSEPLSIPPREEIKTALARHFLWLEDDKRAAQWIAYIDVRTPPTPLQPFGLTLAEVKKNPDWRPWEISSPLPNRTNGMHPSLKMAESNAEAERMRAASGR